MFKTPRFIVLSTAVAVFALTAGFVAFRVSGSESADGEKAALTANDLPLLGGDAVQQAALADGAASQEDRRVAADATVSCIRDAGIQVSDPSWDGQRYRYSSGPFASKSELDSAKPVLERCYAEHLRGLDVMAASSN